MKQREILEKRKIIPVKGMADLQESQGNHEELISRRIVTFKEMRTH